MQGHLSARMCSAKLCLLTLPGQQMCLSRFHNIFYPYQLSLTMSRPVISSYTLVPGSLILGVIMYIMSQIVLLLGPIKSERGWPMVLAYDNDGAQ